MSFFYKISNFFTKIGLNEKFKENIRQNRWKILLFLAISSVLTVIYINNVREINSNLSDIRSLEKSIEAISTSNEELNSTINRLNSADRVISSASEKLNMYLPKEAPLIMEYQDEQ